MKVLFVGDTHGNETWCQIVTKYAAELGADVIMQTGDFGYWEHNKNWGKRFLNVVSHAAVSWGVPWVFLDGNHENHPLLWRLYHDVDELGFVNVRDGLSYAPRAHTWEWAGKKFMSLGGAYSIDKDTRHEGMSWWATELIRDVDVAKALHHTDVDVLVTHDAPTGVEIPSLRAQRKDQFPLSLLNREKLQLVVETTRPTLLVHGHYHERYSAEVSFPVGVTEGHIDWHAVQIEGLACDPRGMGDAVKDSPYYLPFSTLLIDLADLPN